MATKHRPTITVARKRGAANPQRWSQHVTETSDALDLDHGVFARADPASILHLYRRLLSARRNSPALRFGSWRAVDSPPGVLAYERASTNGDDRRIVVVNFTDVQKEIELPGEWTIEIASDGDQEGEHYRGRVSADQALILT